MICAAFALALWAAFAGWIWWAIRDYLGLVHRRDEDRHEWTEDEL